MALPHGLAPFAPPKLASLSFAVAHMAALWVLLWLLHRRHLYFAA